jgi:hypothetical protein
VSNIQVYGWTTDEFERMALDRIYARVGYDRKDMIKNFHCASLMLTSVKEAIEMRRAQETCYEVAGFISVDDSGKGRAFRFLIEKGLGWKDAEELADKLALQVDQCCDRMLADIKSGRSKWS